MSEEEIISLQELKYAVENIGAFDIGDFNFDGLKILLEYLEKESKQIEELQYLENSNWQQYANLKKKIKDKIEEVQIQYEETLKTVDFKEIETMNKTNFKGITLEGQRTILQELLNDENV